MLNGSPINSVLVTGGAGYIGSHCSKELSLHGFTPVAFDNLSTGNRRAVRWGPLIEGNVSDTKKLRDVLAEIKPLAVIHFAASAYVGESITDPQKYYENNVGGMLSLLNACRETGTRHIILSSSCATYGIPDTLPITEDTVQNPINPYGRTKLMCERMLEDYAAAYGFSYAALRYFNAAGADPQREIGEWHEPETHLIPRALLAAAGKIPKLDVFGDDYPTPDGTCVRDYIHVTDLAAAHVLSLRHLLAGGKSLRLNLGTSKGHSIFEVLESIRRVTGKPVPISLNPRRAGDPPLLVADGKLAMQKIDFTPSLSELDTIIATASPFFGLSVMQ